MIQDQKQNAYTPGPWRYEEPDTQAGEQPNIVREVHTLRRICQAVTEPDARLIAAAPALLAALRALVEALDNGQGTGEELIEARAVLAAAEWQTP